MAAAKKSEANKVTERIVVPPPNEGQLSLVIVGRQPFVSNAFPQEAKEMMMLGMTETGEEKKKRLAEEKRRGRPPKNFDAEYTGSLHTDPSNGRHGVNVMAVKAAMVRACKSIGLVMTDSKMFFDVVPDGYDQYSNGVFYFIEGTPRKVTHYVRNSNGSPDIRGRAMFDPGWKVRVTLTYDRDLISAEHVVNLLARAGAHVGIGAGRQLSTNSVGMGWGGFRIESDIDIQADAAE